MRQAHKCVDCRKWKAHYLAKRGWVCEDCGSKTGEVQACFGCGELFNLGELLQAELTINWVYKCRECFKHHKIPFRKAVEELEEPVI